MRQKLIFSRWRRCRSPLKPGKSNTPVAGLPASGLESISSKRVLSEREPKFSPLGASAVTSSLSKVGWDATQAALVSQSYVLVTTGTCRPSLNYELLIKTQAQTLPVHFWDSLG